MAKRVFVIHGFRGRAEGGWRPWLKGELEPKGFQVNLLQMPTPDHPEKDEWVRSISQAVGKPGRDCFFVGHSLGVPAILRYIESLPAGTQVGGVVLVAGPIKYPRVVDIKSFYPSPFNWEKIKAACPSSIGIYSTNDPLVSLDNSELLKAGLGSKIKVVEGMGHFSGEEGHLKLPIALQSLLELATG